MASGGNGVLEPEVCISEGLKGLRMLLSHVEAACVPYEVENVTVRHASIRSIPLGVHRQLYMNYRTAKR